MLHRTERESRKMPFLTFAAENQLWGSTWWCFIHCWLLWYSSLANWNMLYSIAYMHQGQKACLPVARPFVLTVMLKLVYCYVRLVIQSLPVLFLAVTWQLYRFKCLLVGWSVGHHLLYDSSDNCSAIPETCYPWDIWSEWWPDLRFREKKSEKFQIFGKVSDFWKSFRFSEKFQIFGNFRIF